MSAVVCLHCGGELLYVQKVYERHSMAGPPDEDGQVDLVALVDATTDDDYAPWLECQGCYRQFDLPFSPDLPRGFVE